ncbi:hypothetical protein UFOVP1475_2 [uncultured Caudovirales phage]|uniref:Uncharacterized protein n=1 Tax=uncultured Caudovirales phage TaxID=2100421 RepID=A0A6J5SMC0_9CAUD|nr:hypothetical protein UFOVP1475_2 [uncultured Caudovirales phage]
MTVEQIQKVEEIKETLERLQKYIHRETYHILLNGKKEYIKDVFSNIDDMIDDLTDNDTPDIFDMGLNEYSSYEDLVNQSFGNGK